MRGDYFIFTLSTIQVVAVLSYFAEGKWKEGLIWAGAALSNFAYLSLARGG